MKHIGHDDLAKIAHEVLNSAYNKARQQDVCLQCLTELILACLIMYVRTNVKDEQEFVGTIQSALDRASAAYDELSIDEETMH